MGFTMTREQIKVPSWFPHSNHNNNGCCQRLHSTGQLSYSLVTLDGEGREGDVHFLWNAGQPNIVVS